MVRIRLTLKGKKNQPSYRVVVIDSRKKRDGKYIEELGFFNPQLKSEKFQIDKPKYEEWVKKGAKPSESVLKLLEGKYEFVKYRGKKETEMKETRDESLEKKIEAKDEVKEEKIEEVKE